MSVGTGYLFSVGDTFLFESDRCFEASSVLLVFILLLAGDDHVAVTTFRARRRGAADVVAIAGLSSIGLMAVVNFIIALDFKWLILSFVLPWALAFVLYRIERSNS
ncbi:MAG: hypothetical protein ABI877_03035 [Gemmatimonadaceae bacterium]